MRAWQVTVYSVVLVGLTLSVPLAATTERVSVSSIGEQGNGGSSSYGNRMDVSADGRFVAFQSAASNLVPDDTNGTADVFVRDRLTGKTERASVNSEGEQGNGWCEDPFISADGRYVVFRSMASNLVADDTNGSWDVFVHDRLTGRTERVSVSSSGQQGYSDPGDVEGCSTGRLSGNGRFAVFYTRMQLVPEDTYGLPQVYVHDRVTGETQVVSVNSADEMGNGSSWGNAISDDGRYVVFASGASNLVPEGNHGGREVFLRDRWLGTTECVSVNGAGEQADSCSWYCYISGSGRYVSFMSNAGNLVPNYLPHDGMDVYVYDCSTHTIELVSKSSEGVQGNGCSGTGHLRGDLRFVPFHSDATNLVAGDTNGQMDVFVHDRLTGATERVSVSSAGEEGNGRSQHEALSADGRVAVFESGASNLVEGDTNGCNDIFARDRGNGAIPAGWHATFEEERSPWSLFAAGAGTANTWRKVVLGDPQAHSGAYAMSAEALDQAITGLRMALPTDPTGPAEVTVGAWVYAAERAPDSTCFVGFAFGDSYPTAAEGWSGMLGYEAQSDTTGNLRLAGAESPVGVGLGVGEWHLVQARYARASNQFTFSLDGVEIATAEAPGAGGQPATYAVLGVQGKATGAVHQVYFDDAEVSLSGYFGTSDGPHPYALLTGRERAAPAQRVPCELTYGNGYPMLGLRHVEQTLTQVMHVGLSLPEGYALESADPEPSRASGGTVVWDVQLPTAGESDVIHLQLLAPADVAEQMTGRLCAWATTDSAAGSSYPPDPPAWDSPPDAVWGAPKDMLPYLTDVAPIADAWVLKQGPATAAPDERVDYLLTVGNCGSGDGAGLAVRDLMPQLLGGNDQLVAELGALPVGAVWTGLLSGHVPVDATEGEVLLNRAYVPTGTAEVSWDNNLSDWATTVAAPPSLRSARTIGPDGRCWATLSVDPKGGVGAGDLLNYTIECRNTGLVTADPVYVTLALDPNLDGSTLVVYDPDHVTYDSFSRYLVWRVGRLEPGASDSTVFEVQVVGDPPAGARAVSQAVVHLPGLRETAATNIVVRRIVVPFADVPADHWAAGYIRACVAAGIVAGYSDGTYRPATPVDRAQMAVYIARALAGGDEGIPAGPPVATFSDVPPDHWAHKWIEYAVAQSVVGGYPDGSYRPAVQVDRGQMAVFIARGIVAPSGDAGVPGGRPPATFSDVPTDHWAYRWVEFAVDEGAVSGYPDGTYRPAVIVTRDQMAAFVQRAFHLPV
jgi:Tol biopolymer transport system component